MALYAFDGTGNSDDPTDRLDTNVVRFRDLYVGDTVYLEGIGTRKGQVGYAVGGILGLGGRTRIEEMFDALVERYPNDDVIDVIGFSRGAALALHFVNKLHEEGADLLGLEAPPRIRFLGVFDLVGSFGLSFDTFINFQEINLGWDIESVPATVGACAHAMALDERRETFDVTRLESKGAPLEEVWFRGAHSDIGGGNDNALRSNIALQWMLEQAEGAGLQFDATHRQRAHFSATDRGAPVTQQKDPVRDPARVQRDGDVVHASAFARMPRVGDAPLKTVVFSEHRYNWANVHLEQGAKYNVRVASRDDQWQDGGIECKASGWTTQEAGLAFFKREVIERFERFRRVPEANWFELIGAYSADDEDRDGNSLLFRLGAAATPAGASFVAEREGDLWLFANDLDSRYGNNEGSLEIEIQRIA